MDDSSLEQIATWNERTAAEYDGGGRMFSPEVLGPTVEFLAELAGQAPALEFAIGTGRVAIPLSERGVPVAGIDVSAPMVDQLHRKVGPDKIPVTVGSMACADAPRRDVQLVYIVYNAISCLLYQDEQIACFQNAARHLRLGGSLVIELWVPQLRRLPPGQTAVPNFVRDDFLILDTYDLVTQRLVSHHYVFEDGKMTDIGGTPHRYVWPAELDVMAKMAGLDLAQRFADWDRSEFTGESSSHVSVWQKPR
jgi:SAM-dependent methyltransferase